MERTFNKTEMKTLKKYENNFKTALYSDYSRNMMRTDLEKIVGIYEKKLGHTYSMNYSCGACQLKLLKLVGKIYFDTLPEVEEPEPLLTDNDLQE